MTDNSTQVRKKLYNNVSAADVTLEELYDAFLCRGGTINRLCMALPWNKQKHSELLHKLLIMGVEGIRENKDNPQWRKCAVFFSGRPANINASVMALLSLPETNDIEQIKNFALRTITLIDASCDLIQENQTEAYFALNEAAEDVYNKQGVLFTKSSPTGTFSQLPPTIQRLDLLTARLILEVAAEHYSDWCNILHQNKDILPHTHIPTTPKGEYPPTEITLPIDPISRYVGKGGLISGRKFLIPVDPKRGVEIEAMLFQEDNDGNLNIDARHVILMGNMYQCLMNGYPDISLDALYRIYWGIQKRTPITQGGRDYLIEQLEEMEKTKVRINITAEINANKGDNPLGIKPDSDKQYILEGNFVSLSHILSAPKSADLGTKESEIVGVRVEEVPPLMRYALAKKHVKQVPVECLNKCHNATAAKGIKRGELLHSYLLNFAIDATSNNTQKNLKIRVGARYNERLIEHIFQACGIYLATGNKNSLSVLKGRALSQIVEIMNMFERKGLIPGYMILDKDGEEWKKGKRGGRHKPAHKIVICAREDGKDKEAESA